MIEVEQFIEAVRSFDEAAIRIYMSSLVSHIDVDVGWYEAAIGCCEAYNSVSLRRVISADKAIRKSAARLFLLACGRQPDADELEAMIEL